MFRTVACLLILALVAGLFGACAPTQGAPQVWIDMPLAGSNLPLSTVSVGSHAADQAGIAEVRLLVDGAEVATTDAGPSAKTLQYVEQMWTPAGPGPHTLTVRARNLKGAWGQALANVTIGGQGQATPTPTAVTQLKLPSPTATVVAPVTAVSPAAPGKATSTPTHLPTATPTGIPTATPTRIPTATPTRVPSATPTVAKPAIAGHANSVSQFFYGDSGCGAKQVTISVEAPNATGVKIYYRLANKEGSVGLGVLPAWTSRDMTPVRSGWTRTIDSAADIPGYDATKNVAYWFQFYFVATNSGGQVQSPTYGNEVTLSRCTMIR